MFLLILFSSLANATDCNFISCKPLPGTYSVSFEKQVNIVVPEWVSSIRFPSSIDAYQEESVAESVTVTAGKNIMCYTKSGNGILVFKGRSNTEACDDPNIFDDSPLTLYTAGLTNINIKSQERSSTKGPYKPATVTLVLLVK